MLSGTRHRHHEEGPAINLTSMVDIVFLMIIFFMVVSTYISAENVRVELPAPDNSVAIIAELPQRLVLNCQRKDNGAGGVRYIVGAEVLPDLAALETRLRDAVQLRPDLELVVRADRRLIYRDVRAVLQAVARAGVQRMNIAAEAKE